MKKHFLTSIALGLALTPQISFAQRVQQELGRGVVVSKRANDMLISWRRHAQEPENILFNIYVGNDSTNYSLLNSTPTSFTSYTTNLSSVPYGSYVSVAAVIDGKEQEKSKPFHFTEKLFNNEFTRILFDESGGCADSLYQVPYIWPCDLNGDGEYDYVVARNYIYGHGENGEGKGDIVEAYLHDGTFLWRYDMGTNVWGVHGQNDMVIAYDMDCDGKGDVVVKSSDLSRFWDQEKGDWGPYLNNAPDGDTDGDGITNYRDPSNKTRNAPQYITVIDGMTGKQKATCEMNYEAVHDGVDQYTRDNKDNYLNGKDYWFLNGHFAICYFDGVHPAIVMEYLDRDKNSQHHNYASAWQYDFSSGKAENFHELFTWSRNDKTPWPAEFHQLRVCDVNGNGKDEMLQGGFALGGDGNMVCSAGISHGDRYVTTDIDPERPGLETYAIQQNATDLLGMIIYDAATGESIKRVYMNQRGDVGRGEVADIDPDHPGLEWWSTMAHVYAANGEVIEKYDDKKPYPVMGVWWNGSLSRECMSSGGGNSWNTDLRVTDYISKNTYAAFTAESKSSSSSLQGDDKSQRTYAGAGIRPLFVGDIYGDWREEVFLALHRNRTKEDGTVVAERIGFVGYTTEVPDTNFIYCLQENPAYRLQCTTRGYYQSAYPEYFLGFNMPKAPLPPVMQADLVWKSGNSFTNGYTDMNRSKSLTFADGKSIVYGVDGSDKQAINVSGTVKPSIIYAMPPKGKHFTLSGEGTLAGEMELWKSQQGKFTINCPVAYTGKTVISEGELELNTTLNSPLELRARGTLSGNATINGKVTFEKALNYEGCRLMPGGEYEYGKITFNEDLTLPGNVYLQLKLNTTEGKVQADGIDIKGNFSVKGTNYITIVPQSSMTPGEYPLLTFKGTFNGDAGKNFKVRGLVGAKYNLEVKDNTLYIIISEQRKAATPVYWTGAENGTWDYANENFKLNEEATEFVAGDEIVFDDNANKFDINMTEKLPAQKVQFLNNVQQYNLYGSSHGISGTCDFIKKGNGELYINTDKNDFTGKVSLEGGRVFAKTVSMAGFEGSFGASKSVEPEDFKLKDVELYFNSPQNSTDHGMNLTGDVTLTVPDGSAAAITGLVNGTGRLIKDGAGQLNLNAVNTYTGGTILRGGTLAMGNDKSQFGDKAQPITVENGIIRFYDSNHSSNAVTFNNPIVIENPTDTLTLKTGTYAKILGAISGKGVLNVNANGTRDDYRCDFSQFAGRINVLSGYMRLAGANGISGLPVDLNNAEVWVNNAATIVQIKAGSSNTQDHNAKLGALCSYSKNASVGKGTYNIGYLNHDNDPWQGVILAGTTINKYGTGRWSLFDTNKGNINVYCGTVMLSRGNGYTIDENGCLTIKDGGTACGKNTKVAKAVVETGGILAVGDTMLVSKLTVDELTANGTISLKIISGKADQLITTKGITLNNAKIEVCDLSGTVKTGDEFKILNGKVSGTFILEGNGIEWDTTRLLSDGIIKVKNISTGINGIITDEPDNVKYYDIDGMEYPSSKNLHGICIERKVKDGKITIRKMVIK